MNIAALLAGLFSGILGNSFDRIYHGEVIDFLDCFIVINNHAHHWPIFNVADIAITVATIMLVVYLFVEMFKKKEDKEEEFQEN